MNYSLRRKRAVSLGSWRISLLLICGTAILACGLIRAQESDSRYWTSAAGRKTAIRLSLVEHDNSIVKLKREDNGGVVSIRLDQLSEEDRAYLRTLRDSSSHSVTVSSQRMPSTSKNWHRFRGPHGNGITESSIKLPLQWSDEENVAWKMELPGAGSSSPVIWGNHIYLTCYTGTHGDPDESRKAQPLRLMLVCVDLNSGKLIWNREISKVEQLPAEHNNAGNEGLKEHGLASSTPFATADGVYVFFGASGLFRFGHDGSEMWRVDCGKGWHVWGSAASPVVHRNLVIVNAGLESKHVLAFDKMTGKEAWRCDWVSHTWGIPVVVKSNGRNLFVDGQHGQAMAIDADTGERLWAKGWFDGGSATLVNDNVAYQVKRAIRFSDSGAEVLWEGDSGGRVPAPLLCNNRLYFCTEGKFQCRDARTGEFVYRERTPDWASSYASALLNGDRVYYVTRRRGTFIVRASDKFELLAHNKFESDESIFNASPAVAGNRLILRSDKAIYCIGEE